MKEKKEQELYQRLNGQRCLTPNILPIRDERNTIFRDFRYINEGNVKREKINIMETDIKREKNEIKKKKQDQYKNSSDRQRKEKEEIEEIKKMKEQELQKK